MRLCYLAGGACAPHGVVAAAAAAADERQGVSERR